MFTDSGLLSLMTMEVIIVFWLSSARLVWMLAAVSVTVTLTAWPLALVRSAITLASALSCAIDDTMTVPLSEIVSESTSLLASRALSADEIFAAVSVTLIAIGEPF